MSCDNTASNNRNNAMGDLSSSSLDSLDAFVKNLEGQGKSVSLLAKAGGPASTIAGISDIFSEYRDGGNHGALVAASGVVVGAAVGGAALAMAFAVLPAVGVGAVAIFVIGASGSYLGNELGKQLGDYLFDPTLEPEFHAETLRNREDRLRDRGIDPNTDPGTLNIRRKLELSRKRAGLPPSDCVIDDIRKKTQSASTIPSPIMLDLDGDGVETISISDGAWFDHADDGFAERTGWAGSDDGLLVRDIDGNGFINSGRELFGSETLMPNGTKAANGFEALKALDANADGVINAQDAAFAELRVWKDANANGRTDAGELLTLPEAGVGSINVGYTNSSHIDAPGNAHRQVGNYTTTSGETRTATDIWVQTNTTQSLPTDWVDVPEDIAALPDAQLLQLKLTSNYGTPSNEMQWGQVA